MRRLGYLHRAEEVRFVDGIFLAKPQKGLATGSIVVTNQAGIARGYYTEGDFEALMEFMRGELRVEGVELDAVYYCPFHPEHGVGRYKQEHEDRKPGTGCCGAGRKSWGSNRARASWLFTHARIWALRTRLVRMRL